MQYTRGFWIGLGVALILAAFITPLAMDNSRRVEAEASLQRECIKARGNWDARNDQCTFNKE